MAKQQTMMDSTIRGPSKLIAHPDGTERIDNHSFDRYLGGFGERRMIQIAAGYTHCLGLTDVGRHVLVLAVSNEVSAMFCSPGWNRLCNRDQCARAAWSRPQQ